MQRSGRGSRGGECRRKDGRECEAEGKDGAARARADDPKHRWESPDDLIREVPEVGMRRLTGLYPCWDRNGTPVARAVGRHHIFGDACQWEDSLLDVGETVDELVSALEDQEGREASAPTDVMLGGFPAKRIGLTVPADLDTGTCTNGDLRYWPGPGPDMDAGLCCNPAGNTDVVYVDGNRLVVVARHYPDSSPEDRAELQAIVDSIRIEP